MSSAIVLVVIAGAWAFVLVPMVRQRHETSTELRSVDRFARTMRVLARRRPVGRQRLVTPRPATRSVVSTGVPRVSASSASLLRAQERAILLWRRRVTAGSVLGFFFLFVTGLVLLGTVGLALVGVAFVEVLGTAAWLRRSARPALADTSGVFRPREPVAATAPAARPAARPAAARRRVAASRVPVAAEPMTERVPARLRPDRKVAARTKIIVREEVFVDHEPTWGVRVLDLNAPIRLSAESDPGDELFDQTRLTG